MTLKQLTKNIYEFYRYDCCWPYAASFFLTLGIYRIDLFRGHRSTPMASVAAYGILLAYYLYNLRRYAQGRLTARNNQFFISYLSFKILVWGSLLLFCLSHLSR